MDFFDQPAYSLPKRLTSIVGAWPYQLNRTRYPRNVIMLFLFASMMAPLVNKLSILLIPRDCITNFQSFPLNFTSNPKRSINHTFLAFHSIRSYLKLPFKYRPEKSKLSRIATPRRNIFCAHCTRGAGPRNRNYLQIIIGPDKPSDLAGIEIPCTMVTLVTC